MSKETSRQTYDNRYIIDAVIRDKEDRTTHVEINGKIYSVKDVAEWVGNGVYEVYTISKEDKDRLVPVKLVRDEARDITYLRSAADKEKGDNLDYLPLATL